MKKLVLILAIMALLVLGLELTIAIPPGPPISTPARVPGGVEAPSLPEPAAPDFAPGFACGCPPGQENCPQVC